MKSKKTAAVEITATTEPAVFGLKVCEVAGSFTIYNARRHTDGSFVREGEPLGSAPTAEEASELLVAMKPESLVKHKKADYFIFGGDAEAVVHFHTQYEKKVGEIVGAPAPKARKAKAAPKARKTKKEAVEA